MPDGIGSSLCNPDNNKWVWMCDYNKKDYLRSLKKYKIEKIHQEM